MRYLIIAASYPFLILGFVWQFIAGSFFAGRIVSTQWIAARATRRIIDELAKAGYTGDAPQAGVNYGQQTASRKPH